MTHAVNILLHSRAPEADRAFFRDMLGFRAVDIDAGWLTFHLPTAKGARDVSDGRFVRIQARCGLLGSLIYFMCERLEEVTKSLEARDVICSRIYDEPWGTKTIIQLPSGGEIGLYQPAHSSALNLECN